MRKNDHFGGKFTSCRWVIDNFSEIMIIQADRLNDHYTVFVINCHWFIQMRGDNVQSLNVPSSGRGPS